MGRKRKTDAEYAQKVDEVDSQNAGMSPLERFRAAKAEYREHEEARKAAEGPYVATCATCACYVDGRCRLNPPSALMVGRWPSVEKSDWCGQWRRRG